MTAAAVDDAWMETCLIAISKIAGSDIAFHGVTETVDFDVGEKDIEAAALLFADVKNEFQKVMAFLSRDDWIEIAKQREKGEEIEQVASK